LASAANAARIYRNVVDAASRLYGARRAALRDVRTVFQHLDLVPRGEDLGPPPLIGFFPAMAAATGCSRPGTGYAEFRVQPIHEARVNINIDPVHEYYHHAFHVLVRPYFSPGGDHTGAGAEIIRAAGLSATPDPDMARAAFIHQIEM